MEHEKCLKIMFHCYAQVEPTLICMSKKMEQAWEKNLQSRKCDRTGDRDSTSILEEEKIQTHKETGGRAV